MAEQAGHIPLNFPRVDVQSELRELTGGRGPDKCIDAVGMEATHGSTPVNAYDRVKQATGAECERPYALRQAIMCCRNGGVVSVIGDYGGVGRAVSFRPRMDPAAEPRARPCPGL